MTRAQIAFGARRVVVEIDEPRFPLRGLKAKGRGGRSAAAGTRTQASMLRSISPGPIRARNHCRGPTSQVPSRARMLFVPPASQLAERLLFPRNAKS